MTAPICGDCCIGRWSPWGILFSRALLLGLLNGFQTRQDLLERVSLDSGLVAVLDELYHRTQEGPGHGGSDCFCFLGHLLPSVILHRALRGHDGEELLCFGQEQ